MRRTPLRPGQPLERHARLAAGPGPTRRTRLKQTRHRKCWRHLRDEPFKAYVRTLPCLLTTDPRHTCKGRVEFSHVKNEGNGGADLFNGIPLCSHAGHRYGAKCWHVMGRDSWQDYWGVNAEWEALAITTDWIYSRPRSPVPAASVGPIERAGAR